MWIPGISAIVFFLKSGQKLRNVGWGIRKWWFIPVAVTLPLAVTAISVFLLEITALGTWSNKFSIFHDGWVDIPRVTLLLGNHTQIFGFFLLNMIISTLFQSLLGCIFTLGEELGWRAYTQEKFLQKYGLNRGLVFLGMT